MFIPKNYPPLQVLLAVDGSEHTQAAVQLLCYLPLPPGSHVIAACVVTQGQKSGQVGLSATLSEIQLLLRDKVRTTTEHLPGHPAQAFPEFAKCLQADLIVMGASGLRAVLGVLLDGVAQQVVEKADRPVWVVRSPCRGLRRILLVAEGSAHSRAAVNYLARLPFPTRTQVRVMHVLPPRHATVSYPFAFPTGSDGLPPPLITEEAAKAMDEEIAYKESEGRAILEQAVKTLRIAGKAATSVLTRGNAATEIAAYSQTQAIDLIVTGSRGFGKIEGWLRGSLSRQLIHSAGCSVLAVRGLP
ncbi:MAG: universal stress protein [Anaerolineae bacterium]|nr:universal stress protein [Anaerolineae bacterium]